MPTFGETTLDGESLVLDGEELLVPLRVPWYRSLPLSCFEDITLEVDGEAVPREAISLEVGGATRPLDDLAERHDEFWRVERTGWAHVPAPAGLAVGATATVTASVTMHIPYIEIGDGVFMPHTATTTRTLEVSAR